MLALDASQGKARGGELAVERVERVGTGVGLGQAAGEHLEPGARVGGVGDREHQPAAGGEVAMGELEQPRPPALERVDPGDRFEALIAEVAVETGIVERPAVDVLADLLRLRREPGVGLDSGHCGPALAQQRRELAGAAVEIEDGGGVADELGDRGSDLGQGAGSGGLLGAQARERATGSRSPARVAARPAAARPPRRPCAGIRRG